MILLILHCLTDIASDQLDYEYFLSIEDEIGIIDDEGETVADKLSPGKDWLNLLIQASPILWIVLLGGLVDLGEYAD